MRSLKFFSTSLILTALSAAAFIGWQTGDWPGALVAVFLAMLGLMFVMKILAGLLMMDKSETIFAAILLLLAAGIAAFDSLPSWLAAA